MCTPSDWQVVPGHLSGTGWPMFGNKLRGGIKALFLRDVTLHLWCKYAISRSHFLALILDYFVLFIYVHVLFPEMHALAIRSL